MTVGVVDRIIEEVSSNHSIWSTFKLADQENLRSEIFELVYDHRLRGFGLSEAERLTDQFLQQAKANGEKLRSA